MTGNPDTSLTIDTHHHILPDFFWQATENANAPVGGLAPLQWSEMGFIAGDEQRGAAADMFRHIYWDTALAASDPVLRMLRDVAGIDQVLFGTDFPYLRRDLAVKAKQRILESSGLNHLEKHAILGGNAARFFPRFHSLGYGSRKTSQRANATHSLFTEEV
jgi:predicted TIM-barrel fold metal-dependent hydrolase